VERGDAPLPPAVLVDRVGVLADLYALADAAYVGGGFGHRGLHSIIEPAALGVPVLFGPQHGNAREADELAAHGGGVIVRNADELGAALVRLLRDDTARAEAARRAAAYVTAKLGGAQRNADLILSLIPRPSPPTHR
jgi:3-deoxy-D-manno-octulosonic-acid transferase